MGKNKRRVFTVYDSLHKIQLEVDSIEEVEFLKWLCHANELGIIIDFVYQPESIILSKSETYLTTKNKIRTLFREHCYTPDFLIFFDKVKYPNLADEFKKYDETKSNVDKNSFGYYIDIKGSFNRNDGGRSFSINQKWVYSKYNIYVHKIIPKQFFKEFGILEEFKYTEKTKKLSKKYLGYQTIEEIFGVS